VSSRIEVGLRTAFFYLGVAAVYIMTMFLIIDPVPLRYIIQAWVGVLSGAIVRLICVGKT